MYDYQAQVIRVIDADTLHLDVDLGCDVHVRLTVRLRDVDAPERGTPEGAAATEYVRQWVLEHTAEGRPVRLWTHKDKKEKYGRYLAEIHSADLRHCLNEDLVANEHAVFRSYR